MNAVDEMIGRYLGRIATAYHNDPTYHAQMTFMRRVLTTVDMAVVHEERLWAEFGWDVAHGTPTLRHGFLQRRPPALAMGRNWEPPLAG